MKYLLSFTALIGFLAYIFRRRLLARLLELPAPHFNVGVERAIPVPMSDGVKLLTDHYWPKANGDYPTVLIRTPYGRGREVFLFGGYPLGELPGQRFAERGYHVIVQGVRGRYDSAGEFEPHINEAADGQATVSWITKQSWFDGRLALWGPSYLGYTAWATAATTSYPLQAIVAVITSAENYSVSYPDGAFGLETRLRWSQGIANTQQLHHQSLMGKLRGRFLSKDEEALQSAFHHLPLQNADEVATGRPIPFFRDTLAHSNSQNRYWAMRDHSNAIAHVEAPVHLIGGWYDYYLAGLLRDYGTLKSAGRNPYLTIGPWNHANPAGLMMGLREGLRWFDECLKDREHESRRQPVRLFIMGADEWRDMDAFPPASEAAKYYLGGDGSLSTDLPQGVSEPSSFTYDPVDPTPSYGGALLAIKGAGPVDNRPLESRADVLCFTTSAFREPLELVGMVCLTLYVHSSTPYTDFHGRLCDVFPDDRSINICDGLIRIRPGIGQRQHDGTLKITIELAATACRFLSGHKMRLQVSSGAHPRWNRNLGAGEEESSAEKPIVAQQLVYHDLDHPSALNIPRILA